MKKTALLSAISLLFLAAVRLRADTNGVYGSWRTQTGSIVRIGPCGNAICLNVARVSPDAPASTDKLNPDKNLRGRPLCGLQIGDGFKPDGPDTASGGHIYDPESGKTYNGKMERQGDMLKLRGFVGVSVFGRTETWKRTTETSTCK